MNSQTSDFDTWEQCPSGTLQSLTKRSQRRRMMKQAAWIAPVAILLLVAIAFNGALGTPFTSNLRPLRCDQVANLLPAYASDSLSESQRVQVEQHLKKCPFCKAKLQAIQAEQSVVFLLKSTRLPNC